MKTKNSKPRPFPLSPLAMKRLCGMGYRIGWRRTVLGMSQKELGEIVHQHQSVISRLELGDRRLGVRDAVALCEALKCSITYLLFGDDL